MAPWWIHVHACVWVSTHTYMIHMIAFQELAIESETACSVVGRAVHRSTAVSSSSAVHYVAQHSLLACWFAHVYQYVDMLPHCACMTLCFLCSVHVWYWCVSYTPNVSVAIGECVCRAWNVLYPTPLLQSWLHATTWKVVCHTLWHSWTC